jgi:hypothetical protein
MNIIAAVLKEAKWIKETKDPRTPEFPEAMNSHRDKYIQRAPWLEKYVRHKTPQKQDRLVKVKSLPTEEKRQHNPKKENVYQKRLKEIKNDNFNILYSVDLKDPTKAMKFDGGSDQWFKENTAITKNGSLVIGSKENRSFIYNKLIPRILDHIKNEKRIIYFLAQDGVRRHVIDDIEIGTESDSQEAIANALQKTNKTKIQDTFDDSTVEFVSSDFKSIDQKSQVMKKLKDKFKSKNIVNTAMWLYAKSIKLDVVRPAGVKEMIDIYKLNIESLKQNNIFSKVVNEFTKLRQKNLLRKIVKIEKAGDIVIAAPSAKFVYILKDLIENL